jgi:hypothetical protein
LAIEGVCTNFVLKITFAAGKFPILVLRGHVVGAADKIENTLDNIQFLR